MTPRVLEQALKLLGVLLAERDAPFEIVVIGGTGGKNQWSILKSN